MVSRTITYFLVDEVGDYIVDEGGNNIVVLVDEEVNSLQAEMTSTLLHAPKTEGERLYTRVSYNLVDEVGDYIVDEVGDNIVIVQEEYAKLLQAQETDTFVHT